MFYLHKPTSDQIEACIARYDDAPFSYSHVGATAGRLPKGYVVDHHRIRLGRGCETYERARKALCAGRMYPHGRVERFPVDEQPRQGSSVAVLSSVLGIWSLHVCRVVYVCQEQGRSDRFAFACGTVGAQVLSGEERFRVEWYHDDGSVWYDLMAFWRPARLEARIGYPLLRHVQKHFAHDSLQAMAEAAAEG